MKSLLISLFALLTLQPGPATAQIGLERMTANLSFSGDEVEATFSNLTFGLPSWGPLRTMGYVGVGNDQKINGAAPGSGTTVSNYLVGATLTYDFFALPTVGAYLAGYSALQTYNRESSGSSVSKVETAYGIGVGSAFRFANGQVHGEVGIFDGGSSTRIGAAFKF